MSSDHYSREDKIFIKLVQVNKVLQKENAALKEEIKALKKQLNELNTLSQSTRQDLKEFEQ